MKLIIQPDDGLSPLTGAIKRARKRIDLVIFRFDRPEIEKALAAAVARGVLVRALIAHTNSGGEKNLRKLELRLLDVGVTVARTADDLPRYHGKMLIIDDTLFVLGFNLTKLDIEKSRSFGLVTRNRRIVAEASKLFEADMTRQPYTPGLDAFVVSPENARASLTDHIKAARQELLIYDAKITDRILLRALNERAKAGVAIRIIGKVGKGGASSLDAAKLRDMRVHVRAILRDGRYVFVGSQSLRKPELDGRREVGLLLGDAALVKRMRSVFEADWALTGRGAARDEAQEEAGTAGDAAVAAGAG